MASFLVETVTSPSSTGALGLYRALVDWLATHPQVSIIDVDVWRENSPSFSGLQRARILYSIGGSTDSTWGVRYYRTGSTEQTDPTKTASQQFNDDIYAGVAFGVQFFVDITEFGRQYASSETFLVFGVDTSVSTLRATSNSNLIGQPQSAIASGASGLATMLDATGANLGTATITNIGLNSWPANQRSYVVADPLSGMWVGIPSGVTASLTPLSPPTITTTLPIIGSTYITQTKPVG